MRRPARRMRRVVGRRAARRDGSFAHLSPNAARMARRLFVALAGLGERRVGDVERLWIELAAGVASCLERVPGIVASEGPVVACGITGELIAHPRLYADAALGDLARGLDDLLARFHRVEYAASGEGAAYVPLATFRRGGASS